jgi:putative membrane protein
MKRTCFLSMLLAAALTTACAGDADHNQASTQPATQAGGAAVGTSGDAARDVSNADHDFVREITAANMAEMQMAKLALERASDSNVKKFAQMVVTDHTQAGEKLNSLASQHNLVMRAAGDAEKNPAEAFADKRGVDFDREYADTMVDAHQDMVDKLESRIDTENLTKWKESNTNPATGQKAKGEAMTVVAEKSDNPVTLALNHWAAETYPVAFAHLQAAKDLKKGLERRGTNP